jgi:hypothetical protein
MRRALGVMAVALLLCACTSDPYPMPSAAGASQRNPARIGEPTKALLVFLQIRPNDHLELIGAEPIGLADGATMRFFLSRPIHETNGDTLIGEGVEPLEGSQTTAAGPSPSFVQYDNTVGIVGELTAHRPGRFDVTSVRLRYRLNGGDERVGQGIDVVWTVCADDPAPSDCSASPAP